LPGAWGYTSNSCPLLYPSISFPVCSTGGRRVGLSFETFEEGQP
jgi:hypothetical protein